MPGDVITGTGSSELAWLLDPGAAEEAFAASVRHAESAPGAFPLMVPAGSRTLFAPRAPFVTEAHMKLPVGRQRMEIVHVSDYQLALTALQARSASGPLSQAFEPPVLRWLRRHLGVGHVNRGGPWMFDEPALHDVRRLISAPFKPARIALLETDIQATTQKVLAQMLADNPGEIDVGRYANEVHFRMMARVIGVTEGLAPAFREWMRVFNNSPSLAALNRQPQIRRRLGRLAARTRAAHRAGLTVDGLIGHLAVELSEKATIGRGRLRNSDVVSLLWAVIAAGTDTPATAATQTVLFCLQSGDYPRLSELVTARQAVAESIRYYPPFPKPLMKVMTDGEMGGYPVRKSQWVEVHLPAANRDPSVFAEPDRFVIGRPDAKEARSFGDLPHYCIGSHYGQLVSSHTVATLAQSLPVLTLTPPFRRHIGLLHRLDSLPAHTNERGH